MGLIAMGHSGLTGEGTAGIGEAVPGNSWATGDNPEVHSIYLRLAEARPENLGHVANSAHGGASAFELPAMARTALQRVPYPALAIISTIDNDIRCDGTDGEHVPELGNDVAEALDIISSASPNTKILVIGQMGRPSVSFVQELVAAVPQQKESLSGTDECAFFDPDGNLVEENFETLSEIIQAYEDEEANRCAEVPSCHTDGGARKAWVDRLEWLSADYSHLNIAGQAAEAENLWPVVEEVLGL